MLAVLALIANISFAETIIWQEDWSTAEKDQTPADVNSNYTYVDGGSKTKIYIENLAGGTAPELLVGKNGGKFTANINLNGASGEMTLRYKCNKNFLKVTSETANVTIGEATANGNDYELTVTVPAGTATLSLIFNNDNAKTNTRLDDIVLFQGIAKKTAGLSWGTASRDVTIGSADNKFPTLSNTNNLPVTYASDNEEVAKIDAEGVVTLIAAGKAVISASFAGNDEYEAQTVSYTLTVKAASTVDISNTPETAYTVAKALELINAGEGLDTKVYVKGTVSTITEINMQYGNATYFISDDGTTTNQLSVYRGYYLDGEKFTSEDQLEVGDDVVVYGKLVLYNSKTPQITTGSTMYSKNGVTAGVNGVTADMTAKDAPVFNLAGQRVSSKFNGIVIQNGKKFINRK